MRHDVNDTPETTASGGPRPSATDGQQLAGGEGGLAPGSGHDQAAAAQGTTVRGGPAAWSAESPADGSLSELTAAAGVSARHSAERDGHAGEHRPADTAAGAPARHTASRNGRPADSGSNGTGSRQLAAPHGESARLGRLLRRVPRWAVPVAGVGLGVVGGLGYGLAAAPQYAATAYVLVVPQHTGDSQTALGFAQAYGRITTGPAVLAGAQQAAGRPEARLRGAVQAETSPDAPMIAVTGTAPTGATAARIADAVANSLTATGNREADGTGVRLLLFSRAAAPTAPSSPSATLSAAVGGCAGGLLGALVLLVRPRDRDDDGPAADPYAPPHVPAPARERAIV